MIIKQLSVFLENKKGRLCAAAGVLADHGINIRALSLADTAEFGVLRLIVDQPEKAREVLVNSGIVVNITDVLAVSMNDTPGGTLGALNVLADASINVEYLYACVGEKDGRAFMIMQTDDTARAEAALRAGGFADADLADIYRN